MLLNYSVGGLYLSAPREFVISAETASVGGGVLVSFAHPRTGLPLRVAARVVRVERAAEGANVLRVGLCFEQPLLGLSPDSPPEAVSSEGILNEELTSTNEEPTSSFSKSLDFVLEDGLLGGARVVSLNRGGVRLTSGVVPRIGAKITLQLDVDGVPFEVTGRVAEDAFGDRGAANGDFAVELAVEAGSEKWDLYLKLLERAGQAVTSEMPALKLDA